MRTVYLTPDQLAARWQGTVKIATLTTWRSRGTGPKFVKLGGRVVYREDDVLDYEKKNTRGN